MTCVEQCMKHSDHFLSYRWYEPTAARGLHQPPANIGDTEQSLAALQLPALVFCRSGKRAPSVARELAATLGWDRVGAYQAGLTKEERTAIEEWFFSADNAVLVATCANGMP